MKDEPQPAADALCSVEALSERQIFLEEGEEKDQKTDGKRQGVLVSSEEVGPRVISDPDFVTSSNSNS